MSDEIVVDDFISVAFMVTSDRPTDDPGGDQDVLAERVERVLRDLMPDHMIRRLDRIPTHWVKDDPEVWV